MNLKVHESFRHESLRHESLRHESLRHESRLMIKENEQDIHGPTDDISKILICKILNFPF